MPNPLSVARAAPLMGCTRAPGDKSISHRALIFGALASGQTRITGLLEAEDILATARALKQMGVPIERDEDGTWQVTGRGLGGLARPGEPLDFANAGTGVRLMLGVLAGQDFSATCMGDASLSRRPMGRVLAPLLEMGAEVEDEGRQMLPLVIKGTPDLVPIRYELPVASAQVKSAVLLAGLNAPGRTTVVEPTPTRDHTERMLAHFGAKLDIAQAESAGAPREISVTGQREFKGRDVAVPGDPSSAAFLVAAATIVPGSQILVENVLVNATRVGFYTTLRELGAKIDFENEREQAGEPVADLRVRASELTGGEVPAERAPSMIDEYPVLAAIAGYASGTVRMDGLGELRVKESDRLAAMADGLVANGVAATIEGDALIVEGRGRVPGGATVETHLDHRIAMAFLTMGLASDQPVTVDDRDVIATSFPQYLQLMETLGAKFTKPV